MLQVGCGHASGVLAKRTHRQGDGRSSAESSDLWPRGGNRKSLPLDQRDSGVHNVDTGGQVWGQD